MIGLVVLGGIEAVAVGTLDTGAVFLDGVQMVLVLEAEFGEVEVSFVVDQAFDCCEELAYDGQEFVRMSRVATDDPHIVGHMGVCEPIAGWWLSVSRIQFSSSVSLYQQTRVCITRSLVAIDG